MPRRLLRSFRCIPTARRLLFLGRQEVAGYASHRKRRALQTTALSETSEDPRPDYCSRNWRLAQSTGSSRNPNPAACQQCFSHPTVRGIVLSLHSPPSPISRLRLINPFAGKERRGFVICRQLRNTSPPAKVRAHRLSPEYQSQL